MPPIEMIALKPLIYAGKRRKAGEEFPVRGQNDARVLIAIGHADFAPADEEDLPPSPAAGAPQAELTTATVQADPAADEAPAEAAPPPAAEAATLEQPAEAAAPEVEARPRRIYRRRDLTAES